MNKILVYIWLCLSVSSDSVLFYNLPFEIKKNNIIINNLSNDNSKLYEDYCYIGLNIIDVDSVTVCLKNISDEIIIDYLRDGYNILGYIDIIEDKKYDIYINKSDKFKHQLIETISHELIHLKQFDLKIMINTLNPYLVYYNNVLYDLNNIDYFLRPWEIDAYTKQFELEQKMRLIYNNL